MQICLVSNTSSGNNNSIEVNLSTPKTVPWIDGQPQVSSVSSVPFLLEPLQIGIFAFDLISHIRQRAWQIRKISQWSPVRILWTQPEQTKDHVVDLKKTSTISVGGRSMAMMVDASAADDCWLVIHHRWLMVKELLLTVLNHDFNIVPQSLPWM